MEYQKAAQIRKKSLISLIAENKFKKEQSLGSSIGTAISEKFKAKATGIKEKFDPLNIISKIVGKGTFGKIATTIAGRALGKSERDISYFGGYGRKRKSLSKKTNIGQIDNGGLSGGSDPRVIGVLSEMYSFMQKTHEKSRIQSELEESIKQEQLDEDEIRHDKLVKAIKSFVKVKKLSDPSKPSEEGGLFDWITNMITKIKDEIMKIIDDIMKIIKPISNFLSSALFTALRGASWLIGFLGTPFALATALGLGTLWKLYNDKNPEETNKNLQNALGGSEVQGKVIMEAQENTSNVDRRKENILADRPLSKKSILNPIKDVELKKKYLEDIGWDNNTGLTQKERDQGFTGIDEKGIPVKTVSKKSNEMTLPTQKETLDKQTPSEKTTEPPLVPKAIPEPINQKIPSQENVEQTSTTSENSVVAIKNNVNNLSGGAPKMFNMDSIKIRDSSLIRHLWNSAVNL